MLTKKQRDLLMFINAYINTTGLSPSFEEMKAGLDLKSKSGIHRLVTSLVERGFLVRLPNKARALEVRKLPETAGVAGPPAPVGNDNGLAEVPLYGKIAAGTPIEALRPDHETIRIPAHMLGLQACYALTIEGDSMIKAGIMDCDVVIIEKCDRARDGDIVVALVDGEEATLKRLRWERDDVLLMPENDAYTPMRLPRGRVQIQGRLRSLLRTY